MNNNRAVTSKILTLNDLIQEENFNSLAKQAGDEHYLRYGGILCK